MMGLVPVLPRIEAAFGSEEGSGYLAKMVVAIVGLSIMAAAPLSGRIARRFRCGNILVASFLCYALAAIASALAPSLGWLVAARFVQGIGVAIGVTTLLALVSTLYEPYMRDRLLGWHMGGSALALLVILPLAGAIGDLNWRLAPLLGLLSLAHLGLALHARHHLSFRLSVNTGSGAPLDRATRIQALILMVLAFLIGLALYSPAAFVPFKMVSIGAGSGQVIGMIGSVATAASALASLFYPRVFRRVSRTGVYALALPCCAASGIIMAMANSLVLVILAQVIGGVGGGLLVAHIYVDCAERVAASSRAFAIGLVKSSSFAGLFAGPLLLEAVVAHSSINVAFISIAAIAVAALVVVRTFPQSKARDYE
jgi:MFS family permease